MRVSVIGGSTVPGSTAEVAERVGRLLGERGHTLVCGGLGGAMAAACRGARDADGSTVGLLPGDDVGAANPHVQVPIATGMGNARNALVVLNGDAAIAIDGHWGTLSEIALALDQGRPVAGLQTHDVDGVEPVDSAAGAVEFVEAAVG